MVDALQNKLVDEYKQRLDDLLSFCDSPIEKIMLLHLMNYFGQHRTGGIRDFTDLEFLVDEIDPWDPELSVLEKRELTEKVKRYSYRLNFFYEKVYGFKVRMTSGEGISGEDFNRGNFKLIGRELEIYPQKAFDIEGKKYRIDIALILNRIEYKSLKDFYNSNGNDIIEIKKVAIECDGYEFHSTREQITNDNIRMRKLESKGWRVLRYSGSELYRLESTDKFHGLFNEIIEILNF
jgi:hypothetical protein